MGRAIAHRGPDDAGSALFDRAGLHNQRLSIIDVAAGHQPMYSDDGQICVVQNGEIFNYVELTDELKTAGVHCRTVSDTEVILRLYELQGISFVSRLNGMFAIAIYDQRINALWLVRDRLGVKPLFYHYDGCRLLFASEIKALLSAGVSPLPDLESIHLFLTFNFVPPPATAFEGIRHLPPGMLMRCDPSGTKLERWWDLAAQHSADIQPKKAEDELLGLMADAVRIRMRSDVPFGAFLSGGLDSSSVVGLMAQNSECPVDTFSIGFEDPKYDETPFAEAAAVRFHTRHHSERVASNLLDFWPLATYFCDQPHGDVSFLPTYALAKNAARSVKVVLTGDGGDELFAGYDKYVNFFRQPGMADLSDKKFSEAYTRSLYLFDETQRNSIYGPALTAAASRADPIELAGGWLEQVRHQDRINQVLYLDTMLLLPGNNLVKPDRMGMAVSLEARTPLLDYRIVELSARIPGTAKLSNGVTKYIFKNAVATLLGPELVGREKAMFTVPISQWLSAEFRPVAIELLLGKRAANRGLFRMEKIREILTQHLEGTQNHTRQVRALIALELWFRIFIDRATQAAPQWIDVLQPAP